MSIPDVTKWDRLELVYPGLHASVRGRGPRANALRCAGRVEGFETGARLLEERGGEDAATREALEALGREYQVRVEHWSVRSPMVTDHPMTAGFLIGVAGLIGPLAIGAAIVTEGPLVSLRWWETGLMTLPIALPAAYLAVRSALKAFGVNYQPSEALNQRRCTDCGFAMEGTPAGISKALLGVDVGPRACPACERPWPLVPPPVEAVEEREVKLT